MIELGKVQTLTIVKFTDFGAYLSEDKKSEERVLLPIKHGTRAFRDDGEHKKRSSRKICIKGSG